MDFSKITESNKTQPLSPLIVQTHLAGLLPSRVVERQGVPRFSPRKVATLSTLAPLFGDLKVLSRKRMSAFTFCLLGLMSRHTLAPKDVYLITHHLNMNWIDAMSDSTKMVAYETRLNFGDEQLIDDSVSEFASSVVKKKAVIVVAMDASCPLPASSVGIDVNFGKDSGEKFAVGRESSKLFSNHVASNTGNVTRLVQGLIHLVRAVLILPQNAG